MRCDSRRTTICNPPGCVDNQRDKQPAHRLCMQRYNLAAKSATPTWLCGYKLHSVRGRNRSTGMFGESPREYFCRQFGSNGNITGTSSERRSVFFIWLAHNYIRKWKDMRPCSK